MLNRTGTELTGLAYYLYRDGIIDFEVAKKAWDQAIEQKISFTCYLVRSGILSSQKILECCAKNFGFSIFDLKKIDEKVLQHPIIKPELIYHYHIIPLFYDESQMQLGMSDPTNHAAITAIGFLTGLRIEVLLVDEMDLDRLINIYYQQNLFTPQIQNALLKWIPNEENIPKELDNENENGPIIEFVDRLIQDAICKKISDIHIEPYQTYCRIRFRKDGLLYEVATLSPRIVNQIITRLKIMANLDIAERRMPQDGRFHFSVSNINHSPQIDIRFNSCPTLFGEKIVLRILDGNRMNLALDELGMTEEQKQIFIGHLQRPQGLIIVTGPTGSGKTITLYSALKFLNSIEKNILSVEDPIEIELNGINQVNINSKIGLNFATILRTFLRQDPDIIMVGEIRDTETANITIQAALTGHLVLATLHTNSALEAITRLQSIGIPSIKLCSSITLIIAQRLIRKLCDYCKQPQKNQHDSELTYEAQGCDYCHSGYAGRVGVFEMIPITNQLISAILAEDSSQQLLAEAKREKCILLWESALKKVHAGLTSYKEIMRAIGHPK